MPEIMDDTTIAAAFSTAASAYAGRPFLVVPPNEDRSYLPSGFEMSYGEAGQCVEALASFAGGRVTASATVSQRLPENWLEDVLHAQSFSTPARARSSGRAILQERVMT